MRFRSANLYAMESLLRVFIFLSILGVGFSSLLNRRLPPNALLQSERIRGNDEELSGAEHSCYRNCVPNDVRSCVYNMTVAKFLTMSAYCGGCPYNSTDCFNPGCITAGGFQRMVSVANGMMPGPSIFVCLNDTVVINLRNQFKTEATTIHWHGIHQIGTPWEDGVPFVSQCPILPGDSFQYVWSAYPVGTHMWHAHTGYQEADGLFGQLVVRSPEDVSRNLYDYDLAEHSIIVWHWLNQSVEEFFLDFDYGNGPLQGYDITINGLSAKTIFTKNGKNYTTPRATFQVKKGSKYRFRMAFNAALYCPVQVSVDEHSMLMIGSDSGEFAPISVNSFIGNAGERYDFVISASATIGAYWINFRGVGIQCNLDDLDYHVRQQAILVYEGSTSTIPKNQPVTSSIVPGTLLNPVTQSANNYSQNHVIKIVELNGTIPLDDLSGTPNLTLYFEFRINTYLRMNWVVYYPQVNNITYVATTSNMLTQYQENEGTTCNPMLKKVNCDRSGLCECPHVQKIQLHSLVEVVLVNTDLGADVNEDHPIHLHGYHFQVAAMETVGPNISVDYVRSLNEAGRIKKRLNGGTRKDTISIPNSGYAIYRFRATNPGYWMMHCHFSDHVTQGMAVIMQVGEDGTEIPQPSSDFPQCGNYPNPKKQSVFMLPLEDLRDRI